MTGARAYMLAFLGTGTVLATCDVCGETVEAQPERLADAEVDHLLKTGCMGSIAEAPPPPMPSAPVPVPSAPVPCLPAEGGRLRLSEPLVPQIAEFLRSVGPTDGLIGELHPGAWHKLFFELGWAGRITDEGLVCGIPWTCDANAPCGVNVAMVRRKDGR